MFTILLFASCFKFYISFSKHVGTQNVVILFIDCYPFQSYSKLYKLVVYKLSSFGFGAICSLVFCFDL